VAAKDADILVFVVPHQFITRLCDQLSGNIKSTAIGLTLIKVRQKTWLEACTFNFMNYS
jgi:glycerol-3-phosphate dehydrogenase